ncbi:MAG: hypothetical protein HQM09_01010 [Candidatus Riflebacteria bacterium]|nr:hypothetical protein [Candidatus Riflebacteria bacterium]
MNKQNRYGFSFLAAILGLTVIMTAQTSCLYSWDNVSPHRQMNEYAWSVFLTKYVFGPGEKSRFRASPFSTAKLHCDSMVEENVIRACNVKTMSYDLDIPDWIKHGGFSADVPNYDMSIRHFYDPTESGAKAALTDTIVTEPNGAETLFGLIPGLSLTDAEKAILFSGINARDWALSNPENPFCWQRGLEYYRNAIERDDLKAEERTKFLANAFKSLGETMHLLADMTCPAHVRNDNHLSYKNWGDADPIERSVGFAVTESAWKNGPWHGMIPRSVQLAGVKVDQLFQNVAAFTNRSFLSDDTIYSRSAPIVAPYNSKKNYSSPQLTDLDSNSEPGVYKTKISLVDAETGTSDKGNAEIRLARATSWYDWLGSGFQGKHRSYEVPDCYAQQQANLLIPLAVYANAELINSFFPTMNLSATITDLPPDRADMRKIHVDAKLVHDNSQDLAWHYQQPLLFSGEGRLVRKVENGKEEQLPLTFKKGVCAQDVYVNPKDELRVEVETGGRIFTPTNPTNPPEESKTGELKITMTKESKNRSGGGIGQTGQVSETLIFRVEPSNPAAANGFPPRNAMFKWTIANKRSMENDMTGANIEHDESGAPFIKRTYTYPTGGLHGMLVTRIKVQVDMVEPARSKKTSTEELFVIGDDWLKNASH